MKLGWAVYDRDEADMMKDVCLACLGLEELDIATLQILVCYA
jgi:hypothetical protein